MRTSRVVQATADRCMLFVCQAYPVVPSLNRSAPGCEGLGI